MSDPTFRTGIRCHEPCPTALSGHLGHLECTVEIGPRGHGGHHRTTHKIEGVGKLVITWKQKGWARRPRNTP